LIGGETVNVLVAGGAGYIGSHAVRELQEAGHSVVVYDSLEHGHAQAIAGCELITGDIGDPVALGSVFAQYKPDVVMNFAAYTAVAESMADPSKYYRNNVSKTLVLLDAMCAAEPEAEDMESLHLQVGYVRDKRVGIVTDLHNIYTSPIQVRGSDLCLLMIGTGTMLLVDQDVYDRINAGPRSPEARRLSAVATELGNSLSALAICRLISVKDRDTAYLGANAVAYSGIACLTLKAAFGRARPWQREGPYAFAGPSINEDYNSMPSGHSATAFALATVLAKQYPEYKYVFYACASLIAVSRVYVHAHWPSDVLVGAALGVWSANQVMGRSRILEICW
jgi:membrane-associated phospholipid phosphatase